MNLISIFIIGLVSILVIYKLSKIYFEDKKTEKNFISVVNHAFRTPLTRINWITQELEKSFNPNDEKLIQLQGIENATGKILNMVDTIVGIRDYKNTSGYDFKSTSIREIIEKSISKYREEIQKKNITFQISPTNNIPSLSVDLKKISFVIDEIIENAVFYNKKDGIINIDIQSNNKTLIIKISDQGIGLSMMDKIMMFNKFYRNKRAKLINTDGIGLSMYLAKEILKRHNASINASSSGIEKGITITIQIPFTR